MTRDMIYDTCTAGVWSYEIKFKKYIADSLC